MAQSEREELHDNVVIPTHQAERERDHLIEQATGETPLERMRKLAFENNHLY